MIDWSDDTADRGGQLDWARPTDIGANARSMRARENSPRTCVEPSLSVSTTSICIKLVS